MTTLTELSKVVKDSISACAVRGISPNDVNVRLSLWKSDGSREAPMISIGSISTGYTSGTSGTGFEMTIFPAQDIRDCSVDEILQVLQLDADDIVWGGSA